MAQFLRPNSDVTVGTWTTEPLFSKVNETTSNDSPFISSNNNGTGACELGLSSVDAPENPQTTTLRIRYKKQAADGHTVNLTLRILENGTERFTHTYNDITEAWTTGVLNPDLSAVTSWAGLRVELERTGSTGGATGTRRTADVSWIELEVQDAAAASEDHSGGSEATVNVTAEGSGQPGISGSSESTVNVTAEGAGQPSISGGSEAAVNITSEGSGTGAFSSSSEATVNITAEGGGSAVATQDESGGSEASVSVTAEGAGAPSPTAGSEATVNITAEGSGIISLSGGSEATLNITAEGGGTAEETQNESGGSEAAVSIAAEGGGTSGHTGGSESQIITLSSGEGAIDLSGGSEATVSIAAEGGGIIEEEKEWQAITPYQLIDGAWVEKESSRLIDGVWVSGTWYVLSTDIVENLTFDYTLDFDIQ